MTKQEHIQMMIHWCKQFELARVKWLKANNPSTSYERNMQLLTEAAEYAQYAVNNGVDAGLDVETILAAEISFIRLSLKASA